MKNAERKTYLSDDFAMFSDAGNQAVGDMLRSITKSGPITWEQALAGRYEIEETFPEVHDTAVRGEIFDWLTDNDLITDAEFCGVKAAA